jgi:hypothetical protein
MSVVTCTITNSEGEVLGEKIIRYSDISQKEIEDDKEAAKLIVEFNDKRRGKYVLDVTPEEAQEYADKGRRFTE